MDLDRLSIFFGHRVVRFTAPSLSADGKQRVHVTFDDNRTVTGIGRDVGEAVVNAGRRRLIKAVAQ